VSWDGESRRIADDIRVLALALVNTMGFLLLAKVDTKWAFEEVGRALAWPTGFQSSSPLEQL